MVPRLRSQTLSRERHRPVTRGTLDRHGVAGRGSYARTHPVDGIDERGHFSGDFEPYRFARQSRSDRFWGRGAQLLVRAWMPQFDWLIVGAGITGCTLAERLAAAGHRVGVVEQRDRVGGNCSERIDGAGVLVHEFGPHIFHTDSDAVFQYLSRFTEWRTYTHRVLANTGEYLMPMPVNNTSIRAIFGAVRGAEAIRALVGVFGDGSAVPIGALLNDDRLRWIGKSVWEAAFSAYSAKQWGASLPHLDDQVFARVPIRLTEDDRYFVDHHQGVPSSGYQPMFEAMLAETPRIDVLLGERFHEGQRPARLGVVFTGAIDEYFGYRFGCLPYRSVRFQFVTHDSAELVQPAAVINYVAPSPEATRSTEFRQLTGQHVRGTTVGWEYPFDATAADAPMYPVPSRESAALFARYAQAARSTPGVHFCGRLGTYSYLNMDAAVARALALADELA